MKAFVVVFVSLCFAVLASADEISDKKNLAAEACKKELKATDDVVNILKTKSVPQNEAQRCFVECMYGKLGLLKDGKLNSEGATLLAKAKFGDDKEKLTKAGEIFKKCDDEIKANKSTDKCAVGQALRACLIKYDDQLPIFPKSR